MTWVFIPCIPDYLSDLGPLFFYECQGFVKYRSGVSIPFKFFFCVLKFEVSRVFSEFHSPF